MAAGPIVALEPDGKPAVLSYDVPEPTTYTGRAAIDLAIDSSHFKANAAEVPPARKAADELPNLELDDIRRGIEAGALDPAVFPHLRDMTPLPLLAAAGPIAGLAATVAGTAGDPAAAASPAPRIFGLDPRGAPIRLPRDGVGLIPLAPDQPPPRSVLDLLPEEILENLKRKRRLRIFRTIYGDWTYTYQPEPQRTEPRLLLIETYRISSYLRRYGAGRTIKTFSLLPGESTRISIKSYLKTETERKSASSVLDSFTSEAALDLQSSIDDEQTSKSAVQESSEYELGGNFGLDLGFVKIGGGGGGGGASNTAREEMSKRATNAISKHAQKSSAKRDVTVNTSFDVKEQTGEETATEREIANINVGRTLNFVFRQLNQEFVTLVHLVDVRVAFFNGFVESKREAALHELDDLLAEVLVDDAQVRQDVRDQVLAELDSVFDYQDEPQSVVEVRQLPGAAGTEYLRVPKGEKFKQVYSDGNGGGIEVPGVIVRAETNVLRTEGVIVEALLGQGEGLDLYSQGLQREAVEARKLENQLAEAEAARRALGVRIVEEKDADAAELFARVFPPPPPEARPSGTADDHG